MKKKRRTNVTVSPNSPDDKITTTGGRYEGRPTARLITFVSLIITQKAQLQYFKGKKLLHTHKKIIKKFQITASKQPVEHELFKTTCGKPQKKGCENPLRSEILTPLHPK